MRMQSGSASTREAPANTLLWNWAVMLLCACTTLNPPWAGRGSYCRAQVL